MLGSDAVLRALEREGVRVCFGMPGGAILPIYDAIARGTTVRHVLVRHEQGAGHMAQGYARACGEVGVVFATSGPGATNLVTAIADAAMDSTPLVCITGQVRSHLLGSDAFQECDIIGVTTPLVKHSWLVREVSDLPGVLKAAFQIARSGRPGPVLVDIPRDVQEAAFDADSPNTVDLPGWTPPPAVTQAAVVEAVDEIVRARRPVLYVGGGAQSAESAQLLLALAELARIPVVATLMGKGAFAESHELFFGWPGMHGAKWANWALGRADLILAAGARFDDRVTGRLEDFAREARVVHFEIDDYEIDKIRRADVPVAGDLGEALGKVVALLRERSSEGWRPETSAWLRQLAAWRNEFPLRYDTASPVLKPQRVLERVRDMTADRDDVIWTTGVGKHQMWAMQYLACSRPRSFVTSGGHATMGFGLPAALGAKAACPESTVICIDGDGSFEMTLQELHTSIAEQLPVIIVIVNNGNLGMVHQWQDMFYDGRLSHVDLTDDAADFAALARAYRAIGFTVHTEPEFDAAFATALVANRTTVLDVHVDSSERCYPMIGPSGAAMDMLEWPGTG
jgi:acetolactate synthase-1/2/3 large subunit